MDPLQKSREDELSLRGLRDFVIFGGGQGKSFKNIKRNYKGWYTWSLSILDLIGTMLCTHYKGWLAYSSTYNTLTLMDFILEEDPKHGFSQNRHQGRMPRKT